jgi:hypothetical protein
MGIVFSNFVVCSGICFALLVMRENAKAPALATLNVRLPKYVLGLKYDLLERRSAQPLL